MKCQITFRNPLVLKRTDKAHDLRVTFHRVLPTPVLSAKEGKFYGAVQSPSPRYWSQLQMETALRSRHFRLDDTKLPDRIAKARAAMRERADSPTISSDEERTLDDGFHVSRILKEMTIKRNPAA